jgi:fructoselysine-6-P-deglycase FrlB-like protein
MSHDMHADAASDQGHVDREIRRQPSSWRTAIQRLDQFAAVLPQPGERVAVIGCGTSWFMADAYAALREQSGGGETDSFAASRLPVHRGYDRVIAISRSGTTTEVIRAAEQASAPFVAITALPDSPLAAVTSDAVVLDFADEESVVQTVFATTTLMLLRASLGEDLDGVIDQAEAVLDGRHPLAAELDMCDQVTFIGQDLAYGTAQEAALKLREAAQLWTEAYPQLEYRHGPISIAQPGRAVWVMGRPEPGIVPDVVATGASVVDDDLDPVADLVRAQLFAVRRARLRGLDPDRPRNLTRSVILADALDVHLS